jgi:hypothetical protein
MGFMLVMGAGLRAVGQATIEIPATVLASELNVRDTYLPGGRVIGVYPQGTLLRVLGREDQPDDAGLYVYVNPVDGEDLMGWVLAIYLRFEPGVDLTALPILPPEGIAAPGITPTATAPPSSAPQIPQSENGIAGTTREIAHMYAGPGDDFAVLLVVPEGWPLLAVGRTEDAAWIQAVVNHYTGWMNAGLLTLYAETDTLPIPADAPIRVELPVPLDGPSGVIETSLRQSLREVYMRGQELGNYADVFSKVGDSITASNQFLTPLGQGEYDLDQYGYLEEALAFFSGREGEGFDSFANSSFAARSGWSSDDVLEVGGNSSASCYPAETRLECEYRMTRPSIALIMLGTNDVGYLDSRTYRANMERIVQISLDLGIIPVLSTIPDRPYSRVAGRVFEFNAILVDIARTYEIPLWDYWLALQGLPNQGLSADNIHPSSDRSLGAGIFSPYGLTYGYNMRNLTALMMLYVIREGVIY